MAELGRVGIGPNLADSGENVADGQNCPHKGAEFSRCRPNIHRHRPEDSQSWPIQDEVRSNIVPNRPKPDQIWPIPGRGRSCDKLVRSRISVEAVLNLAESWIRHAFCEGYLSNVSYLRTPDEPWRHANLCSDMTFRRSFMFRQRSHASFLLRGDCVDGTGLAIITAQARVTAPRRLR